MLNKFWTKSSLCFKTLIVLMAIMIGSMSLFIGVRSATAASLKSVSIINSDVLTLGDLFNGVTHNADYVIGAAPQPGQDMTLNARTLYRIAVAMDLPWRPLSGSDQVTIRRQATIVSYEDIEQSLRAKLQEKGAMGRFNINLNTAKPSIVLPHDLPAHAEVESMNYDIQKDYFQATIVAPSVDNPIQKINVSGIVERMVSVPVLNSNLRNGDIIGANDIRMIEVTQKSLQHDVIMDKEELIGLTPRRIAHAGKYILNGMLQRPLLVNRGDKVSITYQQGPLVLSAKGKALEAGSKGDYIRVTNASSSRTVDAVVTGENQVIVQQ